MHPSYLYSLTDTSNAHAFALCAVARYLLLHGLHGKEGVIFLDEQDRKMMLVRSSMSVMPVQNAGIPDSERFVFYDQVWLHSPFVSRAMANVGV